MDSNIGIYRSFVVVEGIRLVELINRSAIENERRTIPMHINEIISHIIVSKILKNNYCMGVINAFKEESDAQKEHLLDMFPIKGFAFSTNNNELDSFSQMKEALNDIKELTNRNYYIEQVHTITEDSTITSFQTSNIAFNNDVPSIPLELAIIDNWKSSRQYDRFMAFAISTVDEICISHIVSVLKQLSSD